MLLLCVATMRSFVRSRVSHMCRYTFGFRFYHITYINSLLAFNTIPQFARRMNESRFSYLGAALCLHKITEWSWCWLPHAWLIYITLDWIDGEIFVRTTFLVSALLLTHESEKKSSRNTIFYDSFVIVCVCISLLLLWLCHFSSPLNQFQCAPTDSRTDLFIPDSICAFSSPEHFWHLIFFLFQNICLHITLKKIVLFLSFGIEFGSFRFCIVSSVSVCCFFFFFSCLIFLLSVILCRFDLIAKSSSLNCGLDLKKKICILNKIPKFIVVWKSRDDLMSNLVAFFVLFSWVWVYGVHFHLFDSDFKNNQWCLLHWRFRIDVCVCWCCCLWERKHWSSWMIVTLSMQASHHHLQPYLLWNQHIFNIKTKNGLNDNKTTIKWFIC